MGIITNIKEHGGTVSSRFDASIRDAQSLTIATGYVSNDTVEKYRYNFSQILTRGGDVNLLVGMALFQGLSKATYDCLCSLNQTIHDVNPSSMGVKVIWQPPGYHGKVYRIRSSHDSLYMLGSSNFSNNGLDNNIELVTQIKEDSERSEIDSFIDWMFNDKQSTNIAAINDFPIIENARAQARKRIEPTKRVSPPPGIQYIDIPFDRIDEQQHSCLNAFFGKGRWARYSGVVTPRGWYEVEIIVTKEISQNPLYPKGEFTAHTDDGQTLECSTQGDYYKNLRSRDDLKILGHWIKGKLEAKGVLVPFEPVTSQTLREYGRDYLRLYKISEHEYFMEF